MKFRVTVNGRLDFESNDESLAWNRYQVCKEWFTYSTVSFDVLYRNVEWLCRCRAYPAAQ